MAKDSVIDTEDREPASQGHPGPESAQTTAVIKKGDPADIAAPHWEEFLLARRDSKKTPQTKPPTD